MFYAVSGLLIVAAAAAMTTPYYFLAPLVIVLAAATGWLYRQPALGLFAIIFMVPLEIFRQIFADYQFLTLSKAVGVALVLVMSLRLALRIEPSERLRSAMWIPILGLVGVYLLSTLASSYPLLSLDGLRQLLTAISIFGLGLLLADRYGYRTLIHVIVLSVSLPAVMIFLSGAGVREDARATGLLADPNFFCMLIVVALPLALYLIKTAHASLARLMWCVLLVLQLAAFMRTYSRAGMVVLAVIFLIAMKDYTPKLRPKHFGVALLFIVMMIPAAVVFAPEGYMQRIVSLTQLSTSVQSSEDRSLGRRASYVFVGWDMLKRNPLLGSGPGTFPEYYAHTAFAPALAYGYSEDEYFRDAHNTYLQVTAETGILGLLAFGALLWLGLRNLYRARRHFRQTGDMEGFELSTHLGLALLGLSLFLLFLSSFDHKYLWFLLAVSELLARKARATQADPVRVQGLRFAS